MTNSAHGVMLYRHLVRRLFDGDQPAVDLDDNDTWVSLWNLGAPQGE